MNLWYGHFIGNFKSPTCPDVPGGKEIFFASTIGLYRHSVAVDLIYRDLTVFCFPSLWRPLCAWEKKIVLQPKSRYVPRNMLMKFFFWNSTAHWAETAKNQPRVKSTAAAETIPAPLIKLFFFGCRAKIIIFTHSIRFLRGCLAPIGCNLDYADFHENPALGLI